MAQPTQTKQWVTKQDGIKNLEQETVSLPKLGDGEVLVKVLAISLNYRDTEGRYMIQILFYLKSLAVRQFDAASCNEPHQ